MCWEGSNHAAIGYIDAQRSWAVRTLGNTSTAMWYLVTVAGDLRCAGMLRNGA